MKLSGNRKKFFHYKIFFKFLRRKMAENDYCVCMIIKICGNWEHGKLFSLFRNDNKEHLLSNFCLLFFIAYWNMIENYSFLLKTFFFCCFTSLSFFRVYQVCNFVVVHEKKEFFICKLLLSWLLAISTHSSSPTKYFIESCVDKRRSRNYAREKFKWLENSWNVL